MKQCVALSSGAVGFTRDSVRRPVLARRATTCAVDSSGFYVCDSYASAYPYDYAYSIRSTRVVAAITRTASTPTTIRTATRTSIARRRRRSRSPTRRGEQRARAARQGPPRRQRGQRGRARGARSDQGADEDAAHADATTPSFTGPPTIGSGNYQFTMHQAVGVRASVSAGSWRRGPARSTGGFSLVAGGLDPRRRRAAGAGAARSASTAARCRRPTRR